MFKHISEILQANQLVDPRIREVIAALVPGGKVEGNSYVALNPTRNDKSLGSFRINLSTAKWIDFATGDRGRDIVSLCAYVKGLSQFQAALYLLKSFGYFDKNSSKPKNDNFHNYENSKHIAPKVAKAPKVQDSSGFHVSKVFLNSPKVHKVVKTDGLDIAMKIWNECQLADNSSVSEYLESRGYKPQDSTIPDSIRYHPNLYHSPTKAHFPAMVALITKHDCSSNCGENEIIGIHRTYLAVVDGKVAKAPISPNKMIFSQAKGGAVRLGAIVGKKLVITEGIETGLSVAQATSLPVWAALSANNMENIIVPSLDVTWEVIIAADSDETGKRAADKLAGRLLANDYVVCIATPRELGSDFNDLLTDSSVEE